MSDKTNPEETPAAEQNHSAMPATEQACACKGCAGEMPPDAIEIKNERLPFWARYSTWSGAIFLLAVLIWACWFKVDVIVQANGKLISDKPTIVMKPLDRWVIREIKVKVGDIVEPGQELIVFDPTINQAEVERLQKEIEFLTAKFDRLKAEFEDKEYAPANPDKAMDQQKIIARQRRSYYQEYLRYYQESILQIEASLKSRSENLAKQRERLAKIREIEQIYTGLYEKNLATSLLEVRQIQMERMEMEVTVQELANSLSVLAQQKQGTEATRKSFIEDWKKSISEEMVAAERELTANRKSLEKYTNVNDHIILRAPGKAMVHELAAFSEGSAVREAEAVITLIPLDGNIELEAMIAPEDIAKIAVHNDARIKISAYPYQKYGTLQGVVRNISADTIPQGDSGLAFYRALITVGGELRNIEKYRLTPGMEAQVEIISGRKRIIEYVLHPLIKALDEAGREP